MLKYFLLLISILLVTSENDISESVNIESIEELIDLIEDNAENLDQSALETERSSNTTDANISISATTVPEVKATKKPKVVKSSAEEVTPKKNVNKNKKSELRVPVIYSIEIEELPESTEVQNETVEEATPEPSPHLPLKKKQKTEKPKPSTQAAEERTENDSDKSDSEQSSEEETTQPNINQDKHKILKPSHHEKSKKKKSKDTTNVEILKEIKEALQIILKERTPRHEESLILPENFDDVVNVMREHDWLFRSAPESHMTLSRSGEPVPSVPPISALPAIPAVPAVPSFFTAPILNAPIPLANGLQSYFTPFTEPYNINRDNFWRRRLKKLMKRYTQLYQPLYY